MGTAYQPKIVTDGLVLCLDAGDKKSYSGSGTTWTDRSGNGYNCTLDSSEVSLVGDQKTLYFNTGISTISGPSTPNAFTTFSAFKKIGTQTNIYHVILGGRTHEMSIRNNSTLRVSTHNGSDQILDITSSSSGYDLLDGNWHFITSRYDGTNLKAFINTEHVGTRSVSGTTSDSRKVIRIGCWESNDYQANGYIPFVYIYDRALTDAEILQNFNATKDRFGL